MTKESREYTRAKMLSEVAREERARVYTEPIELDMSDEELLRLFLRAHEADMTLNEYVAYILEMTIEATLADTELPLGDDQELPPA